MIENNKAIEVYLYKCGFRMDLFFKSKHYRKYQYKDYDKCFFVPVSEAKRNSYIRIGISLDKSKAYKHTTHFFQKEGRKMMGKGIIQ